MFQVFGALVLAAIVESVRSDRWRKAFRAIYFVPSAISLTVAGLLFYFIYQPQTGLLNVFLDNLGLGQFSQAWLGHEGTAIFAIIAMSQWQGFGYSVAAVLGGAAAHPAGAATRRRTSTASARSAASSTSRFRWCAR